MPGMPFQALLTNYWGGGTDLSDPVDLACMHRSTCEISFYTLGKRTTVPFSQNVENHHFRSRPVSLLLHEMQLRIFQVNPSYYILFTCCCHYLQTVSLSFKAYTFKSRPSSFLNRCRPMQPLNLRKILVSAGSILLSFVSVVS